MSRPLRRPLLAIAVLPLVVLVGFQSAWAAFACRIDGKVRDHCCCKPEKRERDRGPADGAPRIKAQSCCDVVFHEPSEAPVTREAEQSLFAHADIIVPTVSIAIVSPRVERVVSFAAMARPPPRVALYLDKHALLR
ncbi:MAG: hypothetical protein H0V17_22170 [Deltaproteobacteria bacterium]|nr:hypothetical protein [Deltaproteobacteria bacterium]